MPLPASTVRLIAYRAATVDLASAPRIRNDGFTP
jgi:hypothetical protein